jgi:hypothetical protein
MLLRPNDKGWLLAGIGVMSDGRLRAAESAQWRSRIPISIMSSRCLPVPLRCSKPYVGCAGSPMRSRVLVHAPPVIPSRKRDNGQRSWAVLFPRDLLCRPSRARRGDSGDVEGLSIGTTTENHKDFSHSSCFRSVAAKQCRGSVSRLSLDGSGASRPPLGQPAVCQLDLENFDFDFEFADCRRALSTAS